MGGFFGGGGGAAPADMVGATSSVAGAAGLVPAPAAGSSKRVLGSNAIFEDPIIVPPYKNTATNAYLAYIPYYNATGVAGVSKRRHFIPVFIPSDGKIDKLTVRTSSASWTGGAVNINIAVWKCGDDGLPSDYVIGGNISSGTAANTTIDLSVSATQVYRGFHFLSFTPESNTTGGFIAYTALSSSQYLMYFGATGGFPLEASNVNHPNYTATTYDQTTHGTFNISFPAAPPIICFQYE